MLHIWINRLRREWVVSNDYIIKKTEQGYRYLMGKMRQGQTDLQQKPLRGEMWTCYSQPTNIIPESAEKWEEKHTSWSGWEIRNKCFSPANLWWVSHCFCSKNSLENSWTTPTDTLFFPLAPFFLKLPPCFSVNPVPLTLVLPFLKQQKKNP